MDRYLCKQKELAGKISNRRQRSGLWTGIYKQRELAGTGKIFNSRQRSRLWTGICKQREVQARYLTVDTDQGLEQVSVYTRELAGTGNISNSRQRSGLWIGICKQREPCTGQ